uniref:Uncharacterized protein n=1 Tax=Cannabis sativa TaxID=3483 RepID=A0A803PV81_CANSA
MKQFKKRRDVEGKQRFKQAKQQLFQVLNQRAIFWRQRSKQLWLKEGDHNSKFFHAKVSARKRNNQIIHLRDTTGILRTWENGLGDVMVDYFNEIFKAEDGVWGDVLECVVPRVKEEHNQSLLRPIVDQEVKDVVFQMHPDKSPDQMV